LKLLLTVDVQMNLNDLGWVRGNLTFVRAFVPLVREFDLESPVVWVLELNGVAAVPTVGMQPHGKQLQVILSVFPPHPRYLAVTEGTSTIMSRLMPAGVPYVSLCFVAKGFLIYFLF
jgi:hypothetical protein